MATLTIPDPSLILLVGPAASGKSTLARRVFAPDEILSSDALRAVVAGDEADQRASRTAFGILHREVARRLSGGRLTVVDATNVRPAHRRPLIDRARRAHVPTVAIVLDLPATVVLERNAARERVVPIDVIERQLGWLRTTVDEGQLAREGVVDVVLRSAAEVEALVVIRSSTPPSGGVIRPG